MVTADKGPFYIQLFAWALRIPLIRRAALAWWPRGALRNRAIAGVFTSAYEYLNRERRLPPGLADDGFQLEFPAALQYLGDGILHGPDAVAGMFETLESGFDAIRWIPERVGEGEGGAVAGFVRMEAEGSGSGVPITEAVAIVFWLERGRVVRAQMFMDRDEALKVAGVPAG